ncbi:MAG TPA: CoA transferase [Nocardioides sp.]|jgi:crotonobetainyl-CoA:carnitine CoA-transferase CaiB-like acyl-CoA transferase|uniref:CaiB/BaiF CoA transferase family protein n=1 Tax=Nocardioides sp. TaxID=35761 RepID=UPI002E2FDA77|nr:CoA transferase [Nocardioides sp.]HEX3930510.1 CoA transferase [Nocardioides sp.]
MKGLAGLRVVEVGTAASIPLAGVMLSNLGAQVIKVESAARPDLNRIRPGRAPDPPEQSVGDAFPMLHELNAGKLSVTLNLKTTGGQQVFRELLAVSDVLIENFAPGWLDRLGMSLADLAAEYPRLVIVAASAYGESGPRSQQRAYAPIMTSLAGLEGLIGYTEDDVIGMVSTAFSDSNSAYFALLAVLAALKHREQSGYGGLVDLSQTECAVAVVGIALAEYQLTGVAPSPHGNDHPFYEPRDTFACRDGQWISIAVESNEEWLALCGVMAEVAELADPRFSTHGARREARDELAALISRWTATRDASDAAASLQRRGIAAAPVLEPESVAEVDPLQARGIVDSLVHDEFGAFRTTVKPPWRIGGWMPHAASPAPVMGGQTRHVLTQILGRSADDVDRLEDEGALA